MSSNGNSYVRITMAGGIDEPMPGQYCRPEVEDFPSGYLAQQSGVEHGIRRIPKSEAAGKGGMDLCNALRSQYFVNKGDTSFSLDSETRINCVATALFYIDLDPTALNECVETLLLKWSVADQARLVNVAVLKESKVSKEKSKTISLAAFYRGYFEVLGPSGNSMSVTLYAQGLLHNGIPPSGGSGEIIPQQIDGRCYYKDESDTSNDEGKFGELWKTSDEIR